MTRRRRIILAAPFVILPLVARLAIGPLGDRIGAAAAKAAPTSEIVAFESDEPHTVPPTDRGSRSPARDKAPVVVKRAPPDAGAPALFDGGARPTIIVPASVVSRALMDRSIHARNAVDEDGKPVGVRIHGVSRYGTGLHDGDVIVSLFGTPTPTTETLTLLGMQAIAQGNTSLFGKILRDGVLWDVTLVVPPPPPKQP